VALAVSTYWIAFCPHWLLAIHRIKLDSNPLLCDLIWFAACGVVPFVLGLLTGREEESHCLAAIQ
jgi:hypothetical protein